MLYARTAWVAALAIGCGGGGSPGDGPDGPPVTEESFFDSCGGKIVNRATGAIDAEEYVRQALAYDVDILDCRFGPRFADAFPGQDDPRATMYSPPEKPVPVRSSAHLETYQIGEYRDNEDSFGVLWAEVLYTPDEEPGPGVDRIYTLDWRENMISLSPQPQPEGGGHPEHSVTDPQWAEALGHAVRHPIAAARPSQAQGASTMILFQGGLVGTAPHGSSFFKFPDGIIPTSIALTNGNELLLATVWDITNPAQPRGRLAVVMLHWGLATLGIGYHFDYDGGRVTPTLLGYVDLPFATPTSVATATNNGSGASIDIYYAPTVAELASQVERDKHGEADPYTWSPIASSGYAIVLSRWENKAAFIDLQPVFKYVRESLVGTQERYDATTGGARVHPIPGLWPRTFDDVPEQRPVIAYTLDIEHPLTALAGRGEKPVDQSANRPILAHIATLEGTVRSFDIRPLVNRHAETQPAPVERESFQAGYNPVSLAWSGDVDPLDPTRTTFGNPRPRYSESFIVASRARRELLWVHNDGNTAQVFRKLRDSRIDDPVNVDRNNSFHSAYVFSVSDFTSRKVITYRIGPLDGQLVRPIPPEGLPPPAGADSIECGGELVMPGHVIQVTGANVP